MKVIVIPLSLMLFGLLICLATPVFGQLDGMDDKTFSPYFFVQSDDPETDYMPLKSTSVKVDISGIIADVTVTQVYENLGSRPLEAIYVFPASTRVAVYGMKMTIEERTITALIRERNEARMEYEQAKQAGQSASLLEQHRPSVFQMSVANILPSDVIRVELRYTELLIPTDSIYEFVYPTVVGPRYVCGKDTLEKPLKQWTDNPYLHEGCASTAVFDMKVSLAAGLPIRDIVCASHKIHIEFKKKDMADISLDPSEKHGGNRDVLLKYRLAGGKIEKGLLLFVGADENFFLLTIQPPRKVTTNQIPPREYIFIVDVSGSMYGFPLDVSKQLLRDLIGRLRPTDRFNVVLFAGGSSVLSELSLPATKKNLSLAIHAIEQQRGGGGTELLPALQRAFEMRKTAGYARTVVIVTDGYVSVEKEAFDMIQRKLGQANLFSFGIGTSVNRYLIEGFARAGMGEPFVVTGSAEAPQKAARFRQLIEAPVLTDIGIDFDGFEAYDIVPSGIPDLLAERPVTIFGKWRGRPNGSIAIRGKGGDGFFETQIDVDEVCPSEVHNALRFLWARHRIAILSDYSNLFNDDAQAAEVTNLGLAYNLLTQYTSFVAVDTQMRLSDGQAVTVKQPLPLPQGVSDLAVGNGTYLQTANSGCAAFPTAPIGSDCTRFAKDRRGDNTKEVRGKSARQEPKEDRENSCIRLEKIDVTEGLSRDVVLHILQKHLNTLNLCCGELTGEKTRRQSTISFELVLDPDGKASIVNSHDSSKKNYDIARCLEKTLETILFPVPVGGKTVFLKIDFILYRTY